MIQQARKGQYDYSGMNPSNRLPSSIKEEFEAAKDMAVGVMRRLSGKGRAVFRRIDDVSELFARGGPTFSTRCHSGPAVCHDSGGFRREYSSPVGDDAF